MGVQIDRVGIARMSYVISHVPITLVDYLWDDISSLLTHVLEYSNDEFNLESLKKNILNGDCLLCVIINEKRIIAAAILSVKNFDSGLGALNINILSGSNIDKWGVQFLEYCKSVAVQMNCTELRAVGARSGWIRLLKPFGWTEASINLKMAV